MEEFTSLVYYNESLLTFHLSTDSIKLGMYYLQNLLLHYKIPLGSFVKPIQRQAFTWLLSTF